MLDFLWLEITRKCNLECGHCYAGSTPRHPLNGAMQTNHWLAILREAYSLGCRYVQFIGGEPTLHPDLPMLIGEAHDLGFANIEVFTNATTITPALCDIFRTYGVQVATSFYSANASDHERNTLERGSYELTLGGILQLIEASIPIRVEYVVLTASEEAYMAARAVLKRLGVEKITRNRLQNVGRARGSGSRYTIGDYCGNCGNKRLSVSNDGGIHPCIMSTSTTLGNVFAGGLKSALNSPALGQFRSSIDSEDLKRANPASRQQWPGASTRNESCGPDHPCGPDGGCGPDDRHCGPDERVKEKEQACGPDHPCGPDGGCGPDDRHCGPDERAKEKKQGCGPDHPCGPDGGCGPDDCHCGPDENAQNNVIRVYSPDHSHRL